MSDSQFRRRTLESLKKEAKHWLDALQTGESAAQARYERIAPNRQTEPTLRDVQHALALEQGFAGWNELKQTLLEEIEQTIKAIAFFEDAALALLDAYNTGTPTAMQRHWDYTWHRRSHEGMRTYVQLDLGRNVSGASQNTDIDLHDARLLVAREHGFESWDDLTTYYRRQTAPSSWTTAKPVHLLATNTDDEESSAFQSREWNTVVANLKERHLPGIHAAGQMTDDMLADLAAVEQLESLTLSGSRAVTDVGLRHLSRLSRLQHLDLSGTSITDDGLRLLRCFPLLETLSLAWTKVTDAGVANLSQCANLVSVNLMGTSTGDAALHALAGKPRVCQLRSGNGVTDAGLMQLHQMPVFKSWQGGPAKMGLLSYDASPNYLLLRGTFSDRGMQQLSGLDGLFALNLDSSDLQVTAAGLAPLVGLSNLSWLAVDAKDDFMPVIASMPRLRFLGCQDTVAGDEGFTALSQSRSIEYLWGRRCHNLHTKGFQALTRMPSLRGLSVSCKNVAEAGIADLPYFPALRELMPMDIPDKGYRHIARCDQLESVILMYCRDTTDAATEHLVRLRRLKEYSASYTQITDRTPELLSKMDSLQRITISGCAGVTNAGLAHLARLPLLHEIRVSGQQITPAIKEAFLPSTRVVYSS